MKKIGFIGSFDKTDLILYVSKILVAMDKKVLMIDSTITQKAKYVVPVIKPTKAYVTDFEDIDVAVGFNTFDEIKEYLGIPANGEFPYDIVMMDIDSPEAVRNFHVDNEVINLKKVLFSRTATKEDNDYLDYLSLGYKIVWNEELVYFPLEMGDQTTIAENQKVAKIKFRKLTEQYKEGLIYIAEEITGQDEYSKLKKVFKQLERNV